MADDLSDALHLAVATNDLSKVKQLLSERADVNAKGRMNRLPLHIAAIKNKNESHFEVAEVLMKNGALVNATDKNGLTPLWYLVQKGSLKIVQLFLEFNANINVVNEYEQTLLFSVVENNDRNVEVVQLLIDLGLDANYHTKSGCSPVRASACCTHHFENIKIVKCLLKNGADLKRDSDLIIKFGIFSNVSQPDTTVEKKLKYLLEYTAVSAIQDAFNCLFYSLICKEFFAKVILMNLVIFQVLGPSLPPSSLTDTLKKEKFSNYYKQCEDELLLAKKMKLKNSWVTFYNILMDSKRKLKNYSGNKDIIEDLKKSDCEKKFPIYGALMIEKMKKGIRRRELYDRSTVLLSNFLPIFNPTHLIIRDIFDCILDKKDMSKFCK